MNYEYSKVQEISQKIWVYQYYELYKEFSADRFLPGPLLPIQYLVNVIIYCINIIRQKPPAGKSDSNNNLQRLSQLVSFESLNMKRALSLVSNSKRNNNITLDFYM